MDDSGLAFAETLNLQLVEAAVVVEAERAGIMQRLAESAVVSAVVVLAYEARSAVEVVKQVFARRYRDFGRVAMLLAAGSTGILVLPGTATADEVPIAPCPAGYHLRPGSAIDADHDGQISAGERTCDRDAPAVIPPPVENPTTTTVPKNSGGSGNGSGDGSGGGSSSGNSGSNGGNSAPVPTTIADRLDIENVENGVGDLLPTAVIVKGSDGSVVRITVDTTVDVGCQWDRNPDVAGPDQAAYDAFLAHITELNTFGLALTPEELCLAKSEGFGQFADRVTAAEAAQKAAADKIIADKAAVELVAQKEAARVAAEKEAKGLADAKARQATSTSSVAPTSTTTTAAKPAVSAVDKTGSAGSTGKGIDLISLSKKIGASLVTIGGVCIGIFVWARRRRHQDGRNKPNTPTAHA